MDFLYGTTKYPCALFKPKVFVGYFGNGEKNKDQEWFFRKLLSIGFKRTLWQLVFPNQTAGIIKKISTTDTDSNEYHIRFYNDGTIECELEVDRFDIKHWSGPRNYIDFDTLEEEFG
ncbi:MAG: hypothetical protein WC776_05410, partial [Patescibacteria group bacterium]